MSQIDDLISELCPEGVEFRSLGEVCSIKTGSNISKEEIAANPGPYPVLNSGAEPLGFYSEFNTESDAIGIASRGSVGLVTWTEGRFYRGNLNYSATVRDKSELNQRFLFYFLLSAKFELDELCTFQGIPALNKSNLEKLRVAVPPLEVQREIVRILDQFTELGVELEAELEARRKQYEHYRNELLSFTGGEARWASLGELCELSNERVDVRELDSTNFTGVDNLLQNFAGRIDSKFVPEGGYANRFRSGDVLMGNIRPYLKKIWFADRDGGASPDVQVISVKKNVQSVLSPRFLYFVLASENFVAYSVKHSQGTKMPRGSKLATLNFVIPIPSISVQIEVIEALEKFNLLVSDITVGLPAEIEVRRKQYEYYRDKLLTFPEAAA